MKGKHRPDDGEEAKRGRSAHSHKPAEVKRRQPDCREIIAAVISLGMCVAFVAFGWRRHFLPGFLFFNNVLGWLSLVGVWAVSVLLWHSAATPAAELDLFPGVRAPVFEWLSLAVSAWPLVFAALLGHWGVFAGVLAWELYVALLIAPFGDAWYPWNL